MFQGAKILEEYVNKASVTLNTARQIVYSTEPGAPVRQRRVNTASDKKSYVAPRRVQGNQNSNGSPKPKYDSESKLANMKSKLLLDKNQRTLKTKVANQNAIRPVQKNGPSKQEFKRPMQKNNAIVQKTKPRNAITAQKTKATILGTKLTQKLQNKSNTQKTKTASSDETKSGDSESLKTNAQETKPTHKTTNGVGDKPVETTKDNEDLKQTNSSQTKQKTEHQKPSETTEKLELDPLLARVLEEELQDIMIQVWQELPDDPVEQDRIAVDKLRNEVGDDFRRVLGLNVTKRLLNIHNNLFVKINFSCRPQMGCLTSFLKEYRIKKFKRIDKNSNIFAAQIDTLEHFDRLCGNREVTCGMARVTVTPCYKFSECPDNLKTIYDDSYYYENSSQESEESIKDKSKDDTAKAEVKDGNEKVTENLKKTDSVETNIANKPEVEVKKTSSSSNNSGDTKNDSKTVENKDILNKTINENTTDPVVKSNTEASKKVIKDAAIKNAETDGEVSKSVAKDDEVNKNVTKDIKINKQETNVAENKNTKKDTNVSTNTIEDTDLIDDKLDIDDYDDYLETDMPENQLENDEELNDEDILALMSEGVVLDECSGSEDES